MFLLRSEDVHKVWLKSSDYFCHFFRSLNLVIFGSTSTKAYRHWVSCERNSSYNFSWILLKLDAYFLRCPLKNVNLSLVFDPSLFWGVKFCFMFGPWLLNVMLCFVFGHCFGVRIFVSRLVFVL